MFIPVLRQTHDCQGQHEDVWGQSLEALDAQGLISPNCSATSHHLQRDRITAPSSLHVGTMLSAFCDVTPLILILTL